jgi:hypothetical protein
MHDVRVFLEARDDDDNDDDDDDDDDNDDCRENGLTQKLT